MGNHQIYDEKWNVLLVLDSAKAQTDSSFWSSNMLGNIELRPISIRVLKSQYIFEIYNVNCGILYCGIKYIG